MLEYAETMLEYYGISHEGCSFEKLARKLEYLKNIRDDEAKKNLSHILP